MKGDKMEFDNFIVIWKTADGKPILIFGPYTEIDAHKVAREYRKDATRDVVVVQQLEYVKPE